MLMFFRLLLHKFCPHSRTVKQLVFLFKERILGLNLQLTRLIAARRSLRATVHKREPRFTGAITNFESLDFPDEGKSNIFSAFFFFNQQQQRKWAGSHKASLNSWFSGDRWDVQLSEKHIHISRQSPLCLLYSNAGSCSQLVKYCLSTQSECVFRAFHVRGQLKRWTKHQW